MNKFMLPIVFGTVFSVQAFARVDGGQSGGGGGFTTDQFMVVPMALELAPGKMIDTSLVNEEAATPKKVAETEVSAADFEEMLQSVSQHEVITLDGRDFIGAKADSAAGRIELLSADAPGETMVVTPTLD